MKIMYYKIVSYIFLFWYDSHFHILLILKLIFFILWLSVRLSELRLNFIEQNLLCFD